MDFNQYQTERNAIVKEFTTGNATAEEMEAKMAALDKKFNDAGSAATAQATGQATNEPELTPEQEEYINALYANGPRNSRLFKSFMVENGICEAGDEIGESLFQTNKHAGELWKKLNEAGAVGDTALIAESSQEFERLLKDLNKDVSNSLGNDAKQAKAEAKKEGEEVEAKADDKDKTEAKDKEPKRPDDTSLDSLAESGSAESRHKSGDDDWDNGVDAVERAGRGEVFKRAHFNNAVDVLENENQVDVVLFHNKPDDPFYRTSALSKSMMEGEAIN